MTEFASLINSPAEQRAILNEIIETFDAREVKTGMERARELAERAELTEGAIDTTSVARSHRRGPDVSTTAPSVSPVQVGLWEEAA